MNFSLLHLEWYESCTILGRIEETVTPIVFCGSDEEPWLIKAGLQQLFANNQLGHLEESPLTLEYSSRLSHCGRSWG